MAAADEKRRPPLDVIDFEVTKSEHVGKALRELEFFRDDGVVLTRALRNHVLAVPTADMIIAVGDVYRAVGGARSCMKLLR